MRHAKSGQWWETAHTEHWQITLYATQRSLTSKHSCESGLRLVESKSGERGIFNREASKKQAEKYGRRDPNYEFGTNPCSEIILLDRISSAILQRLSFGQRTPPKTSKEKSRSPRFLELINPPTPDFPYLRKVWQKNMKKNVCLVCL